MRRVVCVLTPTGYTAVITAAPIKFDHPNMTALMAPEIGEYTHKCLDAALWAVSE